MNYFAHAIVVILLYCPWQAWASTSRVPIDQLRPTLEHRQSLLIINRVVSRHHYKQVVLNDQLSLSILNRYLESLDPERRYFTQKDIQRFNRYKNKLDNAIRQTELDPAFDIFITYRKRVGKWVTHATDLLDRKFHFDIDEKYYFDRSEASWEKDDQALKEVWRKRVKNDIITLRLADKGEKNPLETLKKRYRDILRRTEQLDSDDVFQIFMNAFTLSIEPHTSFMSPQLAENFDINMRLSLEGIGAVLSMDGEYTTVEKTVPGGPAAKSGEIHPGDQILGVAQGRKKPIVDVVGLRLQDVVKLIRGPKGSVVRLQMRSEDAGNTGPSKEIVLVRNRINLEDQAAQKSIIDGANGKRIGVIGIPAFYRDFQGHSEGNKNFRSTSRDVRKLLKQFAAEKVDGVIVDLRKNGGGSLIEATEMTGLFIPSGPVVQVKNSNGRVDLEQDPDPTLVYEGPLAVLVDRYSASASEIFAGAIQDYGRGIIIGEPTFGKGTVQTLIDLDRFTHSNESSLGRLRLTIAQFFRISGGSTQFEGVIPDIIYPTASGSKDAGERSLDNALPWTRIRAADYTPQPTPSMAYFRKRHQARIESDPGFQYLLEEESQRSILRAQKEVSLNEKKRKLKWEEREEKKRERTNRFRRFVGLPPIPAHKEKQQKSSLTRKQREEETKRIKEIGLNEAAKILSDVIAVEQAQRSAMVRHSP